MADAMRMKVLVVDDDAVILSLLVRCLERNPIFSVDAFPNGSEALAAMRSKVYDAAICDISLPDINGFEVLRQAREAAAAPRFVIFITGALASTNYGARNDTILIKKPFNPALISKILLDRYTRALGESGRPGPAPDG